MTNTINMPREVVEQAQKVANTFKRGAAELRLFDSAQANNYLMAAQTIESLIAALSAAAEPVKVDEAERSGVSLATFNACVAKVRNAALEKAAQRCEAIDHMASSNAPALCATRIREMITASPGPTPAVPMSQPNRLVAYAASDKLRELGYAWDEKAEAWEPAVQDEAKPEHQAQHKTLEQMAKEAAMEQAQAAPEVVAMLRSNVANLEKVTDKLLEREKLLMDAIAKKDAEIAALQEDYGKACKLVADMHCAATGRPGQGPRIGVIEDVAAVRAALVACVEALRGIPLSFGNLVRAFLSGIGKDQAS